MQLIMQFMAYVICDVIFYMTGDLILFLLSLGSHEFKWIPFCRKDKYFLSDSSSATYIVGLLFWAFLLWGIYTIYS